MFYWSYLLQRHEWGIVDIYGEFFYRYRSTAWPTTTPACRITSNKSRFQPSSVSASSFFSRILSWATKSEAPNMVKSGISLWEILAACARSVFSKACCSNETLLFVSSAKVRIMEAEASLSSPAKAVSESNWIQATPRLVYPLATGYSTKRSTA